MTISSSNKQTKLIIFFSLIFLSVNFSAATEIKNSGSQLKDSLPHDCFFSGDFKQSRKIHALPKPLLSSGKLFFSCKHGLIWHNESPFPESLIYTDKGIHFRNLPNEEPTVLEGQQHYHLANFLINLLSANTDKIEKDFSITYNEQNSDSTIRLTPTNQFVKKGLNSILINKRIENQTEALSITINNTKGQTTVLNIVNLNAFVIKENDRINTHCSEVITNSIPCEILATPYLFQPLETN